MSYKFNPFTGTLDEVGAGGGAATPGGADTQVQFNDGGALGGDAGLVYDKTTDKLTVGGDIDLDDGGTFSTTLQTVTPTANRTVSIPDATGTIGLVNGPTGSIQFNEAGALNGTSDFSTTLNWNNAATTFTGLKLNVTNTASAGGSNLLDLQVGGTSKFTVAANADISITEGNFANRTAINLPAYSHIETDNGRLWFQDAVGTKRQYFEQGLELWNAGFLGICPSQPVATSADVRLYRDAAGTFAQRNGTNAQTFRLYNTYTDASNFERTSLTRDSSGLVIDAQKGGTGVDPTNLLDLQRAGVSAASVSTDSTGTGYLKLIPTTVGALTAAATVGAGTKAFVTDSASTLSSHHGQAVVGGGTNFVPVFSDGTNWIVG